MSQPNDWKFFVAPSLYRNMSRDESRDPAYDDARVAAILDGHRRSIADRVEVGDPMFEARTTLGCRVHGLAQPQVRGHRAHLADRPVGHQLAQPDHGRAEPGPHRLHGEAAGSTRRRDDLPGGRRGDRERLLHQDRLTGGQRGQGQRAVVRMRGGQVDDIHIRVVEQGPVGAVRRGGLPVAGRCGVRGGERLRPLG